MVHDRNVSGRRVEILQGQLTMPRLVTAPDRHGVRLGGLAICDVLHSREIRLLAGNTRLGAMRHHPVVRCDDIVGQNEGGDRHRVGVRFDEPRQESPPGKIEGLVLVTGRSSSSAANRLPLLQLAPAERRGEVVPEPGGEVGHVGDADVLRRIAVVRQESRAEHDVPENQVAAVVGVRRVDRLRMMQRSSSAMLKIRSSGPRRAGTLPCWKMPLMPLNRLTGARTPAWRRGSRAART